MLILSAAIAVANGVGDTTVSFQEGVDGYTGTHDTYLNEDQPAMSFGSETQLTVDLDISNGNEAQALIRFDNLFGNGAGQIPLGARILSARLTVEANNTSSSGAAIRFYRMLANWSESSTWDSMSNGIQTNDAEASSTADGIVPTPDVSGMVTIAGLENTLQAWSDGATNYGWVVINSSTDGWDFSSSETSTPSLRPRLFVKYRTTGGDIATGLIGHWTVDANADDASGNAYHGVLQGNAAIDTTPSTNLVGSGKLSLDGAGDDIDLASHIAGFSGLAEGTIAGWVMLTNTGGNALFGISDQGDSFRLAKLSIVSGQIQWANFNDASDDVRVASHVTINDGAWHHIAVTVGVGGNQLYLDGTALGSGDVTYFNGSATTNRFFADINNLDAMAIGRSMNSSLPEDEFNGQIDDVRIYNRALSREDIAALAAEAPATVDDVAATTPNTAVNVNVIANDSDLDNETITVLDVSNPANGSVVNHGDGTVTYTPNLAYTGMDTFDYLTADLDDTVSYWRLDGNGTDAVGSHHGALTGTTTVTGVYGNALSFDEVDDRVVVPDFAINQAFSLSFKLKIDDNSGSLFQYIYSHGNINNANSLNVFLLEDSHGTDPNQFRTVIRDANDDLDNFALEFDASHIIGDGNWHTYTLTVATGEGSKVYLDGELQNSDTRGGGAFNPTTSLFFGAREDLDGDRFYGGSLDSMQLFNRALSAEEVRDAHSGGSSLGTVQISVNDAPSDLQVTATDSGGLSFNHDGGNDVYLRADDGDAILGGLMQLTAEVRFSMDAFQNSTGFISYATSFSDNTLKWNIRGNGNLSFTVNGINLESSAMDYRTLADGRPQSLAVTWDNSGAWQMFVNGAPIDSGSGFAVGQILVGGGVLVLGNDQDTVGGGFETDAEFAGTLYDVRIFNDVRTNNEIADNYASTVPNSESGLIVNWTLNDLSTSGVITDTVTGNNLTVMHASGTGFVTSTPVLTLLVDENAATSSVVGTLTGTDPEGDPISYTLTDNAGGRFAIDSNSGVLTVADGAMLDYETDTSHTITVRADDGNATYDEMFTIDVQDLAEGIVVVDTTNDALDGDTDSLDTLLNNKGLDGVISLREAIEAANNTANGVSADEIRFDILDALVGAAHTIQVGNFADGGHGALPNITDAVSVNGATDADYSGTPIIVLDGSNAGIGAEGLFLGSGSDGSTIRGLVINQFNGNGIEINGSDGNSIVGNYLGTDVTGTLALNNFIGIRVDNSANTIIGGQTAGTGNLISGNSVHGIYLKNAGTTGAQVYRNLIGTNAAADGKLANGFDGIRMESGSGTATIGNGNGDGNVIAGNAQHGISLNSGNDDNIIQGNYIGTNSLGASNLGNTLNGIRIGDFVSSDNLVGGPAANDGNVIAYNNYGIVVIAGTGNDFQGNVIHTNTNIGIDLIDAGDPASGVSANDTGTPHDADSGPNNLQNYPVLDSAYTTGLVVAVRGVLRSAASTTYRLEFFASTAQDGSGHGEGERFLGARTVTTSAIGEVAFARVFTAAVIAGEFVSATATNLSTNDTSEFALNVATLADTDSDGDGIPDTLEDRNLDGDHNPNTGPSLNTDGLGMVDHLDNDDDGDGDLTMAEDANGNGDPTDDDTDGDGIPDYLDPDDAGPGPGDSDADGVADDDECPSGPPCTDTDGDGVPNYNDPDHLTAVSNVTLEAIAANAGVLIKLKTGLEIGNLGFHLYRVVNHEKVRLTTSPVSGTALLTGANTVMSSGYTHTFYDAAGTDGDQYLVAAIDIDPSLEPVLYGPVTSQPNTPVPSLLASSPLLSRLGQTLPRTRVLQPHPRQNKPKVWVTTPDVPPAWEASGLTPEARQQALATVPALNLLVDEAGWYRVTQPELIAAGLDPDIDPRYLALFADGQPHPLSIDSEADNRLEPDDAIAFYAEPLDTPFARDRRYGLVVGTQPGKRIDQASGIQTIPTAVNFPFTVTYKPRTLYVAAVQNGAEENFFGPVVSPAIVETSHYLTSLAPTPDASAQMTVALQGVTLGDHEVSVRVNGHRAGTLAFTGHTLIRQSFTIPHAWLREGTNRVTLTSKLPETARDISVIDQIEFRYQRLYMAEDGSLLCTVPDQQQVAISGFHHGDIRVLDITEQQHIYELSGQIDRQGDTYTIRVAPSRPGPRTLFAFTTPKRIKPGHLVGNPASNWHVRHQGADMIILAHTDMIDAAKPLQQFRESQGLSVALIDVQEAYDAFSFGAKDPEAINAFLQAASRRWQPAPRFVLLIGAASFDPRDYLGYGPSDWIPTNWIATELLETASDDGFVDLNYDGVPDLPIGRLPARNASEAAAIIDKLIAYEQTIGAWRQRALVVTAPPDDFNFNTASEPLRQWLANHLRVDSLPLGQDDMETERQQLFSGLSQGYGLTTYLGHGTTDRWGADGWLDTAAVRALQNGNRLPIVLSMTCLSGFFHDPVTESLAEAFLRAPNGGAVAVWASSGLTRPPAQVEMQQTLVRHILGAEALTIGEAILRAKQALRGDARPWIFFGDPAMRFN